MTKRLLSSTFVAAFATITVAAVMGIGLVHPGLGARTLSAAPPQRNVAPALQGLAKLQFNASMIESGNLGASTVVLLFDPADPTAVTGGTLIIVPAFIGSNTYEVVSGSLQENTATPNPGDYTLTFVTHPVGNTWSADVALDVLADGTVDLRGVSAGLWPSGFHVQTTSFMLEGTGRLQATKGAK